MIPGLDGARGCFTLASKKWNHHFRWSGEKIIGITAVGRATIEALGMNSGENQIIRTFERILGRHPPPGHL